MKTKTCREAVDWINESNGRFFSVVFKKRDSEEIREMTCRTGVTAKLAEEPTRPATKWADKALIGVYDIKALDRGGEKGAYRSIPMEGLQKILIDGEWYEVTHPVEEPQHALETSNR